MRALAASLVMVALGVGTSAQALPHQPHQPHQPSEPTRNAPQVPLPNLPVQPPGCCALGRSTCDQITAPDCALQGGQFRAGATCNFATGSCLVPRHAPTRPRPAHRPRQLLRPPTATPVTTPTPTATALPPTLAQPVSVGLAILLKYTARDGATLGFQAYATDIEGALIPIVRVHWYPGDGGESKTRPSSVPFIHFYARVPGQTVTYVLTVVVDDADGGQTTGQWDISVTPDSNGRNVAVEIQRTND
jgi:hypothetical protein